MEAVLEGIASILRFRSSRFGWCLKHLEFSKIKIGVTDLLWRSVLKDVSNEITVQVGSKEALGRVEDPLIPRRVSLDGEDQEG